MRHADLAKNGASGAHDSGGDLVAGDKALLHDVGVGVAVGAGQNIFLITVCSLADYAIIGAGAVNVQTGVMDQNVNEAAIARKMIAQSRKCIVLADENKLRGHAMTLVAKWPEVDYLVTSDSGNALEGLIFPANVNVLVAQV